VQGRVIILCCLLFITHGAIAQIGDTIPIQLEARKREAERLAKDTAFQDKVVREFMDSYQFKHNEVPPSMTMRAMDALQQMPTSRKLMQTRKVFKKLSIHVDEAEHVDETEDALVSRVAEFGKRSNSKFDSRYDLLELNIQNSYDLAVTANAFSVFAIIDKNHLTQLDDGSYLINVIQTAQKRFNLCLNEPYANQISIANGTAFLIQDNLLITAFHVLQEIPISNVAFVSGFKLLDSSGASKIVFRSDEVFFPEERVKAEAVDLALIKIKTAPKGYYPLTLDFSATSGKRKVYALGYPLGLPIKLSDNGTLTKDDRNVYAEATLDTYQGNSGSPVFDSSTQKVIGVLTGGALDFIPSGQCYVSRLCQPTQCALEKVLMFSDIKSLLQEHLINEK
jgi:S1-C subfamily serine protease